MSRFFCAHNSVSRFVRVLVMGVVLVCVGGICWGAELTSTTGTKTIKDADDYILTTDVSIKLLEIENNSGKIVVDLQGNNLTITELRMGYYDIFTNFDGYVVFKDSVGGGSVEIGSINATAWNRKKTLEIQSPVTVTINTKLDSDTGGHGGSDAYLKIVGTGSLVVDGTIKGENYLNTSDIEANGSLSGTAIVASYTWTGATSTNWNVGSNWDSGSVPGVGATVIIPAVGTYPVSGAVLSLKNLTVAENASLKLSSGALTVSDSLISEGDVDVAGSVTVEGSLNSLGMLKSGSTISITGTSIISGTITSSGTQTYTGDVMLTGDTTLSAGTSKNIDFKGKVEGTGGSENLTITAKDALFTNNIGAVGNINITGNLGVNWTAVGVPAITCGNLIVSKNAMFRGAVSASSVKIDGEISFMDGSSITTSGTQEYGSAVLIEKDIEFKGTTVTFNGTVDTHSNGTSPKITITGNAVFGANVGYGKTVGDLTVSGTTTLKADVFFKAAGKKITFSKALDGDAAGRSLTTECQTITVSGLGITLPLKDINVKGALEVSSSASDGSIKCTDALSVSGNATVRGNVSAGSLSVTGVATIGERTASIDTGTGEQIYSNDVKINSTSGLEIKASKVTFSKKVNSYATSRNPNLTITADETIFGGIVGDTYPLGALSVSGISTISGNVTTVGDQTYVDKVTLAGAATFSAIKDDDVKTVTFGISGITSSIAVGSYGITLKSNAVIYGENVFKALTIDNSLIGSSTTVQFEGGKFQKIGTISAKGNSAVNTLTLGSTDTNKWKVYFTTKPNAESFDFTKISNSESVSSDGLSSRELEITPAAANVVDAAPTGPSAVNWFVHKYYWVGKIDAKWSTVSNWAYDEEGTLPAPVPGFEDATAEIIFKKVGNGKDLELADETVTVPAQLQLKKVTIEEDNRLGLAGYSLKVGSASRSFYNAGTIAIYGNQSGNVLESLSNGAIVQGPKSTIEYYGTCDGEDILCVTSSGTVKTYENLKITKTGNMTFNSSVNATSFEDVSAAKGVFKKNLKSISDVVLNGIWEFGDSTSAADAVKIEANLKNKGTITCVSEDVTITGKYSGASEFNASSKNTTFSGDADFSTGTFNHNGGTLLFNGSKLKVNDTVTTFYNLEIGANSSAENSFNIEENLIFNANFEAKGTVKFNGATQELSGTGTFKCGGLECSSTTGLTVKNDAICGQVKINSSSSLKLENINLSVSGDFSNEGNFDAGTSNVEFIGASDSVISGESTFYNLKCVTAGKTIKFATGKTQSVSNNLTVKGTAVSPVEDYSKHITLISDSDGAAWNVDCTGAAVDLKYVKMKDSTNVTKVSSDPGADYKFLSAVYSWDDGNNVRWNFPGMLYTWTGDADAVWHNKLNWNPKSIPGDDSRAKIPDVSAGSKPFPELDSAVILAKITIDSGSYVDLKGKDFTITDTASESYLNNGTVKSAGSETVTLPSGSGAVKENGTWEYYAGTVKAISGLSYNKIEITDAVEITGSVTAKEFRISTDKAVTCQAASVVDAPVVLNGEPAGYSFDNAGFALAFNEAITTETSGGADYSLKIGGAGTTTFGADVSVKEVLCDSPVSIKSSDADGIAIKTSGNQTYNNTITGNSKSLSFGASNAMADDRTVTFKAGISGVKVLSAYYPVVFDTSNGDFEVATTGGILLCKDSSVGGTNVLTVNSLLDAGVSGTGVKFISGSVSKAPGLVLKNKVGSKKPFGAITAYGKVDLDVLTALGQKSVVTSGNQIYYGEVEAKKASVLGTGTSGAVQFGNNVSGSAVTILADAYVSDAAELSATTFTVGSTGDGNQKNLHISAVNGGSVKTVTISNPVVVNGNAIFYSGTISVNANLSATQDFIVLGENYSEIDSAADGSGVTNLFAYNNALRTAANKCATISYGDSYKTALPDGTLIPTGAAGNKFGTTLTVDSGRTIQAGKNFYGNGTTLSGSAAWYLKVLDNGDATNAFAELYNSAINNCEVRGTSSDAGAWLSAAENCSGTGNVRVDFNRPVIAEAYTVFDDVVFVRFVESGDGTTAKKIENSNNEINTAVGQIKNSAGVYAAAFTDADCTSSTDGKGDISEFYLKYSGKWNTDATGTSEGHAESTDRSGAHYNVKPYLNIPKALDTVYATLRDEHKSRIKHYSASDIYTAVNDKAAPVLIAVKTGQEKHVAPGVSQTKYDSHNFVEFTYSEEVDFGASVPLSSDNIQATATLGGITNNPSGITVAGLGTFATGHLETGTAGTDENVSVHSLYRTFDSGAGIKDQTHKIRFGAASYVDSAVTTSAGSVNHWLGYIKNGRMPSGVVTRVANPLILDAAGNVLEHSDAGHNTNHALPALSLNSSLPSPSGIYGAWDLSGPTFAPYHSKVTGPTDSCEAVGYTDNPSSAYLDRIEFHVVDNEASENEWFTKFGWAENNGSSTPVVPAKDKAGGAKPFADASERTVGGIRYSSLYDKVSHFGYSVVGGVGGRSFKDQAVGKTSSSLFLSASGGVSAVDDYDSLYFALKLSDSDLPLKTTFEISYDGTGYITDLAGNLLLPSGANIKSIDRVAPNFNISVASVMTDGGVSGDEVYIVFSKALQTGTFTIMNPDSSTITMNGLEAIPNSLRIVTISSDGGSVSPSADLQIDSSVPARLVFENKDYTGLILKLNRAVTLADMEKYYIQCNVSSKSLDPVSGTEAYVTYVQDELGNYMMQNAAHALTDFAVGIVTPVYAYDSSLRDNDVNIGQNYKDGSWAVHDWGRNQKNYGSLAYGYDIFLSTKLNDGSSDGVSELPSYMALYMAPLSKISGAALSSAINKNVCCGWRMWLPDKTVDGSTYSVFDALTEECNPNYGMISLPVDTEDPSVLNFSFDELKFDPFIKTDVGVDGTDQVLFMFGLQKDASGTPVTICHAPDYSESTGKYTMTQMPLFTARLENPSDLTSLDLWSLRLKDIITQRGNVTILNNVINATNGEITTVKVNMPSDGNLNVMVMTLDGNIIQYLQHGRTTSGEHNYTWNGTTKSGKKVARGLYFVRVFGSGIDETRKVMVVKE